MHNLYLKSNEFTANFLYIHTIHRSHTLQADTEEQMQAWISALQRGIGHAIQIASVYSENMCNVPTTSTSKNDSENSIKKM